MRLALEIERAFATGGVVTGRFAVVRYIHSEQRQGLAVISGKRLGNAVTRNWLRRRWRDVVRRGDPLQDGWFVVVVIRARTAEATFQELTTEWAKLARGVGLTRR